MNAVLYVVCGVVVTIGIWDQAFGGLMGFLLLGVALLGVVFVVLVVALPRRWARQEWRSLRPLAVCGLVLPSISLGGSLAIEARFRSHRHEYDAIADAIRTGRRSEKLVGGESQLAHWAKVMRVGDLVEDRPAGLARHPAASEPSDGRRVVGVHFLTVTHGFAGHLGYMRVFDPEAARILDQGRGAHGWRFSKRLVDDWYLVAN